MKKIGFSVFIVFASCSLLKAQDVDSLKQVKGAALLSYSDSLDIFHLIDSLLTLEDNTNGSQIAARLSYNSNVLSAGRTLGIENFGLSPGVSFYHTSGLYADVSAFWSKDFEPKYYLTILSAGYMRSFSKVFTLMAGYDRYQYNTEVDDAYIPYRNAVTLSPYLDLKPFTIRADYTYYFGDDHVHRIMPSVSLNLVKKNLFKIERITFAPAVYLLFGDETLTEIKFDPPETILEAIQNMNKYGTRYKIIVIEKTVFGLMNYAFSFPLMVSHKNWSFSFSYTYSIPRALDDEPLLLSESSFLAGGITYYINLKKKKLSLF
jgi:hypothetical protein